MKKGDIFLSRVGDKKRPLVVLKVLRDIVHAVPLSRTEDRMKLLKCSSEKFPESFFTNSIVTQTREFAEKHKVDSYDNLPELQQVINKIKESLIKVL